jgi:metallo-beta-lactamase class B
MQWYEEWQEHHALNYRKKHAAFYAAPSIEYIEPFKMADDLYYVGDKLVCVHLIRTDEGLILLDAGYPCTKHLLMASIIRLGFNPADVRWIILTHAHSDHFGAANEFRNLYGTKVALSAVDTASMREKPFRAIGSASSNLVMPVIDRELQDGEIFSFGGKEIRCVLTPGHTLGTMSFFFNVTDEGKTYLAGQFGGAGVNALKLPYMLHYELPLDMPQRMVASLDQIKDEPVEVQLGNHPYNSKTLQKRERQLKEGGNPFVDATTWPEFVADTRNKALKIMEDNKELARQHQIEL